MLIGDVNSDVQTRLRMTLMSNIFAKTRSGNCMSFVPPYVLTLPIAWVQLLFKLDKDEISIVPLMLFLNLTKRINKCVITRLVWIS